MATATITITSGDEPPKDMHTLNEISVEVRFDPPIDNRDGEMSITDLPPAHAMAAWLHGQIVDRSDLTQLVETNGEPVNEVIKGGSGIKGFEI